MFPVFTHIQQGCFLQHKMTSDSTKSALKICSWNVGGIHNPIKRKKILSFLKKEHVHTALLQETHLSANEHSKLKCDWVGQVFSSSFTSKSRGVAILINKHLPLSDVPTISDKSVRYVMLKGHLHGQLVSLLNIYFPPVQSNDFISQVMSLFANWICGNSVIAGDFNCYVCGLIISYTARLKKNSIQEQRKLELELHQLQTKFNMSPSEELRNDIQVVKTALCFS